MNKVFKNSIANMLRSIVVVPIFFFLVPYMVSKLGISGFGLWSLIGVVGSYNVFVNFGFTNALVRYVAKGSAQNDLEAVNEYLASLMLVFVAISSLVLVIIFFFREFIVTTILGVKNDIPVAVFLVMMCAVSTAVNMISGLFKSVIDGVQRMEISSLVVTVQVILSAIGTFVVLEAGFGLEGLGLNLVTVSMVVLFMNVYMAKRVLPGFVINPSLFRFARIKEVFAYSINLQLSSLIKLSIIPLNKVIISHVFTIEHVGFFDIAVKLSDKLTDLVRTGITPMFPAAAELYEKFGYQRIESFRRTSLRYVFPLCTLIYFTTIILMPDFIHLWLGPELSIVALVTQLLLVGTYLSVLSTPAYTILNGIGYSRDTLIIHVQLAIVNIVGIATLPYFLGFFGFCVAFAITGFYGFFLTHYLYGRRIGKDVRVYKVFVNMKVVIPSALFITLGFAMVCYVVTLDNYFKIASAGLSLLVLYMAVLFVLRVFTKNDIRTLLGPRVNNRIMEN